MALFTRLFELHTNSIEDYFTEIVAYLFRTNPDILYAWLKSISLLDTNPYIHADISTQQKHNRLEYHLTGSRFDIVIELSTGMYVDIILLESKIGADEQPDQLKKYAEILDRRSNNRKKTLLYVTRDFDPKDGSVILKGVKEVSFKQERWYTLYEVLQSQPENILLNEVIAFMKEHNLGLNNRFLADSMFTLPYLTKGYTFEELIEATIWGRVSEKFKQVVGKIESRRVTLDQLKERGRYLVYAFFQDWWCGLGYHLDQNLHAAGIPGYPPTISLILEVSPTSRKRQAIIKAMEEIAKRPGWRGYHLDELSWSGVIFERDIQDFLSEEDQIVVISSYLLQLLDELAKIKELFPSLPWPSKIT
ncbi:MAG: PD-(D/E)XK nuclease family protein [Anaerolineales bacterium]|nr:PD-(D/E)XK nuclease family protein [Anaerolineales bacterium]